VACEAEAEAEAKKRGRVKSRFVNEKGWSGGNLMTLVDSSSSGARKGPEEGMEKRWLWWY
jgi:hypothetical protein